MQELFSSNTELIIPMLTTTYFQWDKFFKQTTWMVMGSSLSHVLANFYMKKFEEQALRTSHNNPSAGLDTLMTYLQFGTIETRNFNYFCSISSTLTYRYSSPQKKKKNRLPFLDVLVIKNIDGILGPKVYQNPHTDRYLNRNSNYTQAASYLHYLT
jgi:hypothetical protein